MEQVETFQKSQHKLDTELGEKRVDYDKFKVRIKEKFNTQLTQAISIIEGLQVGDSSMPCYM